MSRVGKRMRRQAAVRWGGFGDERNSSKTWKIFYRKELAKQNRRELKKIMKKYWETKRWENISRLKRIDSNEQTEIDK